MAWCQTFYLAQHTLFETLQKLKFPSLQDNAYVTPYDKNCLTFITSFSKKTVSAHTNKGVNIDVNAGTSVLTW